MENQPWIYTVLVVAAPAAFTAVSPVVKGEAVNATHVRRTYVLSGIFALGTGAVVAAMIRKPDPLLVGAAVFLANVAAQEYALALRSVETARPD